MTRKISRLIIETSIVFVSIFTTLSVLLGAVSSDFKSVYFYLGYMLYFALPFIFACLFGVLFLILDKRAQIIKMILEMVQTAFFLTGLLILLWLATSAAQTALLPTTFVFSMPYFSIPTMELYVFSLIFAGLVTNFLRKCNTEVTIRNEKLDKIIEWINQRQLFKEIEKIKKSKTLRRNSSLITNLIPFIFIILFILGIMLMATSGANPITREIETGSVSLEYNEPLGIPVNLTGSQKITSELMQADQIKVDIVSKGNKYVSFYFLNDHNYIILENPESFELSPQMIYETFGRHITFNTVVNQTDNYYFIIAADSIDGASIDYSISVSRIDATGEGYYFIFSTGCLTGFLVSLPIGKRAKQTSINNF